MSVFDRHEKESSSHSAGVAEPQPEGAEGPPPKREMTKAEAEEVLDKLHYCKKHGVKMKEADGAWHCEEDDKEKAAEEDKEAKEAFAVYSKGQKP